MIFVCENTEAAGYVPVVKATRSGEGLFVTSFRRLSSRQIDQDRVVKALIAKAKK